MSKTPRYVPQGNLVVYMKTKKVTTTNSSAEARRLAGLRNREDAFAKVLWVAAALCAVVGWVVFFGGVL